MAGSVQSRLELTRQQILAFRRRVGALDERMPTGSESLRRAAWAGLQDSMPRAALLSLHARVDGVEPSTWEDPSLAQLWGPRYSTYVVAEARLRAVLAREASRRRQGPRCGPSAWPSGCTPISTAARMTDREVGRALGVGNAIRYAATTGTVAIRWEGARAPTVWTVAAAEVDPADACRELARRYLHVFGPTTADGFARWAGISRRVGGRRVRLARGIAAAGPIAARRRVAARRRRAGHARRRRRPPRPRACCRAATPTSCSTEQSGSCSSRARTSGSGSGRPACGRARSSSKARSAEPGDGRTTPCGSTPGDGSRAGRATRSRPRPAPCRFRASSDVSRWSGTPEPRL